MRLRAGCREILALFGAWLVIAGASGTIPAADLGKTLLTIAETSDYRATASSAEVVRLVDRLADQGKHVRRIDFGRTVEGRPMIAAVVAQPPVPSPAALKNDSRVVILLIGGIHSGECAGKEALLMLLRELSAAPNHPWLKSVVLIIAPNFNADANDRKGKEHRPSQVGPGDGMGLRENVQGLDLNRDFIKLETPECRAMVKLIDTWNPDLVIDTHTTNGSKHRYVLTYDIPHNPASPTAVRDFLRNEMMPEITRRMQQRKMNTAYYGNFNADHTKWTTYGDLPRYSTEYVGLRGRLAILAEAHAYIPYQQRVEVTREFVKQCVQYTAERASEVRARLDRVRQQMIQGGDKPVVGDRVPLRSEITAADKKLVVKGYERPTGKEKKNNEKKNNASRKPKDYTVQYWGISKTTMAVQRPFAYLLPYEASRVADRLRMHGISLEQLTAAAKLDVEYYHIKLVEKSGRTYQGHRTEEIDAEKRTATRLVPKGTYVIRTGQPLDNLIVYLLEPAATDGLAAWNFFDPALVPGHDFPVSRLPGPAELKTRPVRTIQPATLLDLNLIYGPGQAPLYHSPATPRWLSDSNSYVRKIGGRSLRVDAETGAQRKMPALGGGLAKALAKLPEISESDAKKMAGGNVRRGPDKKGVLVQWANDLFYWREGREMAIRLTNTKAREQFATFSPSGKLVAFVRDYNVYVVDVQQGRQWALTTEGTAQRLHGQLDWVYQEELYGRGHYRAFWWSPDSQWIALLRSDESAVPSYTVIDNIPYHQRLAVTSYPLAGDPLPKVDLGVVRAAGGDVRWIERMSYDSDDALISRVDWGPGGKEVVYQVQNREQTWLELRAADVATGAGRRLLRETTGGWVSVLGPPLWLKDGSFLWLSERSGNKHIYRVPADGEKVTTITTGPWSVGSIHGTDEGEQWLYFSATKDSPTAPRAYRIRLDGSRLQCLTRGPGSHAIRLNEAKTYFFDSCSSVSTPAHVRLYRADGRYVRMIDPNLDDQLKYYRMSRPEFARVTARDGVTLDGMLIKPVGLDPGKKYPVLVYVYSGPQAPVVRDRWGSSTYLWHQMLAQKGYAVWMCDNRSASMRGAGQAWSCHRKLGQQELQDIEDGLAWLKQRYSWVDAKRIGIWGWSYGGYMTSYSLTHSKLFKVGIAGAPVTDWHNYDAIYTERYMGLPRDNPKGYETSSVVKAAEQLHGRLLLIHGTIDDNVHPANSLQLIDALQNAGRQFDVMFYPRNRHGVTRPRQARHLRELMTRFLLDNL